MPANVYEEQLRGLPKKERKALQREFARLHREDERKRKKRNRIILRSSLIVVAVAVLAIVALVVVNNIRAGMIGPLNMASDGILFTGSTDGSSTAPTATVTGAIQPGGTATPSAFDTSAGKLIVVLYVDYSNADSATFEKTMGSTVQGWVTQGVATLELHPVSLASTDGNSAAVRAANAIACVANTTPGSVLDVHNALIADQATIASAGLSTDDVVALVAKAGATAPAISKCITSGEFDSWVNDATKRAQASLPNSDVATLSKVPTVVVDGTSYTGSLSDLTAFETFVSDTYSKATPASTATPTPTPTP